MLHGCALHAYVLMTNHVHLLVTPNDKGAVSKMMQAIGRRYVGCFNARYPRTGTLWEGRFKAALVDSARYLLTCYRYIELNPVRAGMVRQPVEYRWSTHHSNGHGAHETRITPHPFYLAPGTSLLERQTTYRALFDNSVANEDTEARRAHTQQQRALGSERFRAQVEALTRQAASVRPRERPASLGK